MPLVKPPLGSTLNPAHPLAKGLAGAWLFNQGAGTVLRNNVGRQGDGTITGATWSVGQWGRELAFSSGSNQVVSLGDNFDATTQITITACVTLTAYATGSSPRFDSAIVHKENGGGTAGGYAFFVNSSGRLNFRIRDSSNGASTATGATTLALNTPYHVAATYDGANVRVFVNGRQDGTTAATRTIGNTTDSVGIGNDVGSGISRLDGRISLVTLSLFPLSATTIQNLAIDPFTPWRRRSLATYFTPISDGVSLTANGLLFGTPSLATPTISQTHALTGNNLSSAAPTLATPAISQVHAIAAANLTSGTPTLDTPTLSQTHALTADGLTSANPILSSPILSQSHSLTALDLTSGTPTLGNPSTSGNISLTANDLTSASPVFDTPTVTQAFALTANTLTSGTPSLGTPAISQTHTLTAIELLCGSPTLGTPAVTQVHSLTANNLTSGSPVLGNPAFVNPFIPTRIALTWEVPRGTIRSWEARRPMRFAWEYP